MAKSVQAVLFRWDTEFVELLRATAGPRGMSSYVREAIEARLGLTPVPPVRAVTGETNYDDWGA